MGQNLDLNGWLCAPTEVKCPHCGECTTVYTDDYDIDAFEPVGPGHGEWTLKVFCQECEKDFALVASMSEDMWHVKKELDYHTLVERGLRPSLWEG